MGKSKISQEEINQWLLWYKSGKSFFQIAKEVGRSEKTISKALKSIGLKPTPYKTRMNKMNIDVEVLKKQYEEGKNLSKLAKIYGVRKDTIRLRLIKAGIVDIRNSAIKVEIDIPTAKEMYSNGLSTGEIAEILGVSAWVVQKRFKEHGIQCRDASHPIIREGRSRRMSLQIEQKGCIRTGKNEHILISKLSILYSDVTPQHRIYSGGHHYDAFAGGILWELDEPRHQQKRQSDLDKRYDKEAFDRGYEVRRIKENDLFEYGLEKWHNYQDHKTMSEASSKQKRSSMETREKIGNSLRGRNRPKSFIEKMTGRKNTEKTKQLMSKKAEKFSYIIQCPDGTTTETRNLTLFYKSNGLNSRLREFGNVVKGYTLLSKHPLRP